MIPEEKFDYFNTDLRLLTLNILLEGFYSGQNVFTLDQFLKGNYWKIDYISEEIQDTNDFGSPEDMIMHQVIEIVESLNIGKVRRVSVVNISELLEIAIRGAMKGTGPSQDVGYYTALIDEIYDLKKLSEKNIEMEISKQNGGDISNILNKVNFETATEATRYLNLISSIATSHIEFEITFLDEPLKEIDRHRNEYISAFARDEFFDDKSIYQKKRYYFSKQLENFYDYIKEFPVIGGGINIPFSVLEEQGFEVVKVLSVLEREKKIKVRNWNDVDMWNVKFQITPITLQSLVSGSTELKTELKSETKQNNEPIKDARLDNQNYFLEINNGKKIIPFKSKKKGEGLEKETKQFKILYHLWDFRWELKDDKVLKKGDFTSLDNLARGSGSKSTEATYKHIQRLNNRFKRDGVAIEIAGENEKYRLIINKV